MIVYPNAKINIGLNITEKRNDGFHNLESIFYPIDWCDILEINKSDTFEFTTSGLPIDVDYESNIIIKAYRLIESKYSITACKIHLHKQIPMGAGLGGGSSNASFTLKVLNDLFDLKISEKELLSFAEELGSDCPFFIKNTAQYIQGKGEIMTVSKLDLQGYFIKLVNPNIHISTQLAFRNVKPKMPVMDLRNCSVLELRKGNIVNDFEQSVFPIYKSLEKIKNTIKNENAFYVSMTGTGSTIFGLYEKKPNYTFNTYIEKIIEL